MWVATCVRSNNMNNDEFSQIVDEGVRRIPQRFRERIKNLAFLVADDPTPLQLRENDIRDGETLLGLYEGVPLTERGEYYGTGMVLPDKITIFKNPILEEAKNSTELLHDIVYDTVWHEVAHYFGYDDNDIEKREKDGTNYSE